MVSCKFPRTGYTKYGAGLDVRVLMECDSLFIGHSNFHVENPFQLWQDAVQLGTSSESLSPGHDPEPILPAVAERDRVAMADHIESAKHMCRRPLYNDIGNFHPEELLGNRVFRAWGKSPSVLRLMT
ncbi:unnamed protein product [Symbiodinium sp. KB8]|nr:unnamed protein product [Symbiodinium sp. KB8]